MFGAEVRVGQLERWMVSSLRSKEYECVSVDGVRRPRDYTPTDVSCKYVSATKAATHSV